MYIGVRISIKYTEVCFSLVIQSFHVRIHQNSTKVTIMLLVQKLCIMDQKLCIMYQKAGSPEKSGQFVSSQDDCLIVWVNIKIRNCVWLG